ncbi:MAG TPA: cache domain-containing protein, partial [Rubrivivax sp.]|nr:cache domain-containing protein [Rubrivivax sp.]
MLASVLVIAVSVTVSTLVVIDRVEQRSEQAVMNVERDHAERVASLLQQRVVSLQNMLRATAEAMPPAARTDHAAAEAFLAGKPALATNFSSIFVIRADGELLAAHDGTRSTYKRLNLADRAYFSQTLAHGVPLVSEPFAGRFSNEPILQLTMPVQGAGGRVVAVMGGTLRLASRNLFDDLTYIGDPEADRVVTVITDARGKIIAHPKRDRVMRSIEAEPELNKVVSRWIAQGRPIESSGVTVRDAGNFVSMAGVSGADWMVFRRVPDGELMGGIVQ